VFFFKRNERSLKCGQKIKRKPPLQQNERKLARIVSILVCKSGPIVAGVQSVNYPSQQRYNSNRIFIYIM
jgi:hypothetical protein